MIPMIRYLKIYYKNHRRCGFVSFVFPFLLNTKLVEFFLLAKSKTNKFWIEMKNFCNDYKIGTDG